MVGNSYSASGNEAFRWTASGGIVGLGDLPGGASNSVAYGVSSDGTVVVGAGRSDSGREAFRWTASGGMVGLGDVPGGVFDSSAFGVSADGAVVVGNCATAAGEEAFVWTARNEMQRLVDVLLAHGATGLNGWALGRAIGVSANGRFIVGSGTNPSGKTEAWLADIGPGWTLGLTVAEGGGRRSRELRLLESNGDQ